MKEPPIQGGLMLSGPFSFMWIAVLVFLALMIVFWIIYGVKKYRWAKILAIISTILFACLGAFTFVSPLLFRNLMPHGEMMRDGINKGQMMRDGIRNLK